jgi:hypothetical protein
MGLSVKLITLPGSRHGGDEFYDSERTAMMAAFLSESLKGRSKVSQ